MWEQYLNRDIHCSCGSTHLCSIRDIIIEEGALRHIPSLVRKGSYQNICLVADTNTWKAAGEQVSSILNAEGIAHTPVILEAAGLLPDETGIGSLMTGLIPRCGLIITVGTGTLNDLSRFVSYKLGIEYFIVGTAPSMDGFTSNVAAMITRHTKTTYKAHMPAAMIGDVDILAEAPMDLIAAGVGDIIGKYVCLTDWKIAHLITGEYFCKYVETLVRESIEKIKNAASHFGARDKKAIAELTEGLVLSGIAMSYIGNSRPASGSEHHLSHYWEMMFLQNGEHGAWHGTKVGVGTIVCLALYKKLLNTAPDFQAMRAYHFEMGKWENEIRQAYGSAAGSVIELEHKVHKNSDTAVLSHLDGLESHLEEIRSLIQTLPEADEITAILESMEAPVNPAQIDVTRDMFIRSIYYAKELRNRFGLLQLLFDTGLMGPFAEELADDYF